MKDINDFTLIPTEGMTREQWLSYRENTIGGSDAATIMNVNPYRSAYMLFMHKTGMAPVQDNYSPQMAFGKLMEPQVRHAIQFYDAQNPSAWAANIEKKPLFHTQEYPYVILPKQHPHIALNIDGLVPPGQRVLDAYRHDFGLLEIKTTTEHVCKAYDHDGSDDFPWMPRHYKGHYPFYYYPQIQFYMGFLGIEYAVLAMLKDATNLLAFDIPFDPQYFAQIMRECNAFAKAVASAKAILANDSFSPEEKSDTIQALAPPVSHHDDISKYFATQFLEKKELSTVTATPEVITLASTYRATSDAIAPLEEQKKASSNGLKDFMLRNNANKIILPNEMGTISLTSQGIRVNIKKSKKIDNSPWD